VPGNWNSDDYTVNVSIFKDAVLIIQWFGDAYKISVSKLLENLYFGDRQMMVWYNVMEFEEMGFEDGR